MKIFQNLKKCLRKSNNDRAYNANFFTSGDFIIKSVNYYNFTLTDLYDDNDDRIALSPKIIFGTDEQTLKSIMQGLANNYSEFISVDFNKGIMENVFLNREKKSVDVLELI